jgi:SAM-dependent methyltransferase
VLDRVRSDVLDADRLVRAVASGRRKGQRPEFRRAELRWVDLRAGRRLQVVTYDDTQAFTRNVDAAEAGAAVEQLLAAPYGNWHVETADGTTQVRVTKGGEAQVHRSAQSSVNQPNRTHDRAKQRLLEPSDPVFAALGISDETGALKPSRRDKFHQVEEFLRALEPVLDPVQAAAGDADVQVVDLGCGNAYLSFAAYRWLTDRRGLSVRLTGVDVKAQARQRNTEIAERLGWSAGVTFVEGTIEAADVPAPHLAVALHACDTAPAAAVARAVRWRAPVLLAAPCCHHDVQRQLRSGSAVPAPYGAVLRHGILRERFADVLTDSLRALVLRLLGYRVSVVEFVDSVHTPRNALIRAVYSGADPDPAQVSEYVELVRQWGVRPALAARLDDLLEPIVGAT